MTPLVGLTQRVSVIEEYDERRDCLDQRWGPVLRSHDATPVPLFNTVDAVDEYLRDLSVSHLILTGGGNVGGYGDGADSTPERDAFETRVLDLAVDRDLPVLGVCRGLQFINEYFGGELVTVDGHVGEHHRVRIDSAPPFTAETEGVVNSYHNFGIDTRSLASQLMPLGHASDGTVEYATHESLPVSGIMWHPEREHPSETLTQRILDDFLHGGPES